MRQHSTTCLMSLVALLLGFAPGHAGAQTDANSLVAKWHSEVVSARKSIRCGEFTFAIQGRVNDRAYSHKWRVYYDSEGERLRRK